jgi:site-specific recombinase XerD
VFHGKRHPRDLGAAEIKAFLTWLAVERHVAASTQNQALSGVLFLYRDVLRVDVGVIDQVPRARMPVKVPVVLSADEVRVVAQGAGGRTEDRGDVALRGRVAPAVITFEASGQNVNGRQDR